jgi:hypothetical protein
MDTPSAYRAHFHKTGSFFFDVFGGETKASANKIDLSRLHEWARLVKERDGYKCAECNETDFLHSHHLLPKKDFPELMYDINNGITLCRICHAKRHHNSPALRHFPWPSRNQKNLEVL